MEGKSREPLSPRDPNILAIAADHEIADSPLPVFAIDDITAIADFILSSLKIERPRASRAS